MENASIVVVLILTTLTVQRNVEGTCVDSGGDTKTDVSSKFETTVVTGTANEGFSIKCGFVSANSYSLHLWQLQIFNGASFVIVFTYLAGTIGLGPGYTDRGLTFENNNTVVFPNFTTTDVTKTNFRCIIQLNTASVICTETKMLNIFATPVTRTEHDSGQDRFPIGSSQVLQASGTGYLPGTATFRMSISGENKTLSPTITDEANGFKRMDSRVSFEVPDVESLRVDTFMNVDGSEVLVNSKTYAVYTEPVYLLVLVIVALLSKIGCVIVAWRIEEKCSQVAALVVTIIGGLMSFIFILLMVFLFKLSKFFVATVVLGALDMVIAIVVAIIILKFFWTK